MDLEIGKTIATIDGMPVGENEFTTHAIGTRPRTAASLTPEERKEVLDELLDQKALYLEARRQGLDRDPKVQAQMVQIYLRRQVYNQVRSNDFTEEDLRDFYEAHRDDFIIPEKVRARRLFIKADPIRTQAEAEAVAKQAYARIGGKIDNFNEVAAEISEGPYRGRGGDLGMITRQGRTGVPDEVVERAFGMQGGQISEPFYAGGGYNIVGVMFRREAVERTFEQMRGAVLRRAKAERQSQVYEDTLARLRENAKVDIDQDAVDAIEIRPRPEINPIGSKLDPMKPITPPELDEDEGHDDEDGDE